MTIYRQAEFFPAGKPLKTTICIVGGGAAGLTLAMAFSKQGVNTVVLEGGDTSITGKSQSLYAATQTGLPYFDLTACRLRFLGGTTNHWGGFCRENDPIDYEERSEIGVNGWPISYDDLKPYIAKAATEIGLDTHDFSIKTALRNVAADERLTLDSLSDNFETKVFHMARRLRFKDEYSDHLSKSEVISVILNSNVTKIKTNSAGDQVDHVVVTGYTGHTFTVHAKVFILAAHAIENARLLLCSHDVKAEGIGNSSGMVGRNFMEHPRAESGLFFPTRQFPKIYNFDTLRRYGINTNLSLSRKAMVENKILQYYCRFIPVYDFDEIETSLKDIRSGALKPVDKRLLKSLSSITGNPIGLARFAAYYTGHLFPEPIAYKLDHRIEQAPNPASRIEILREKDALGVPKIALNWQLSALDYKTFNTGQRIVQTSLMKLGMGRFETQELNEGRISALVKGHYHHIGTTRMGLTSRDSVVDKNCKVHDVGNLYIAGSSVFPSSGYSGPTMMIVAFALRLADHLNLKVLRDA